MFNRSAENSLEDEIVGFSKRVGETHADGDTAYPHLMHGDEMPTLGHQNVRYGNSARDTEPPNLKSRAGDKEISLSPANKNFKELFERVALLEVEKEEFECMKKDIKELKSQMQQLQDTNNCNSNNSEEFIGSLKDGEGIDPSLMNVPDWSMQSFNKLRDKLHSNGEECYLSDDTYSFIICSGVYTYQFFLGILVFLLQLLMMAMLFVYFWNKQFRGRIIQASMSWSSKIVQYLATTLAIITQNDFRLGLTKVHEGFPEEFNKKYRYSSAWKWNLANTLRMIIGVMGIFTSFLVIVISEEVLDILMNFAGLEVLLHLDNKFFELSATGIFGIGNNAKAKEIKKKSYTAKHKSSVAQFVMVGLMIMSFTFLGITNFIQTYNKFLTEEIKIEFADNADADIGVCSGVYTIDRSEKDADHVRYVEEERKKNNTERKMIAYCKNGYWTLSENIYRDPCGDYRGDYLARSGETSTFVVEETKNVLWTASKNKIPLDFVLIEKFDKNQCKSCNDATTCSRLGVSKKAFGENDLTQDEFELRMLHSSYDEPEKVVSAYGRPIFVEYKSSTGNSTRIHYYLILFTGRRWIATSTKYIEPLQDIAGITDYDMRDIKDYFSNGFHVSDLLRNGIIMMSDSTLDLMPPINLEWHGVKYLESGDTSELIPSVDIKNEISDAVVCAVCNNVTYACRNKGLCADDGGCKCLSSSTGSRCQYPFVVKECILDDLINHNLAISFDKENVHGAALHDLFSEEEFDCEYETWAQRYKIAVVKHATKKQSRYKQNLAECNFEGVSCNENGDISYIGIFGDALYGAYIPSEMFLLTSLRYLYLRMNAQLPSEIASLTNLVHIKMYNFFGSLPSEIGLLQNLNELVLHKNYGMTGQIPSEIGLLQSLTTLQLNRNNFSGQIPSEIGQLTKLRYLGINNENLSGTIPVEFGFLTGLDTLCLGINLFSEGTPDPKFLLLVEQGVVIEYSTSGCPNGES